MIKRILSYILPSTQKIISQKNGILELTYINGKKVLDSKNTNYSYGKLQTLLEFGIAKIDLSTINSVLLLGMGAGSIIKSLRDKFSYHNNITAVEYDSTIINIAKEEFDIVNNHNTQIINDDVFSFVPVHSSKHELIIIDLFNDIVIPEEVYNLSFWSHLYEMLENKGIVIFNGGFDEQSLRKLEELKLKLKSEFAITIYKRVHNLNNLLIATCL